MTEHETAVQALLSLSRDERTGELVCSTEEQEVHLHLQVGRLAWATSSASAFRFSSHICAECGIDRATYREVLEECRRTRTPLGEIFVQWNLATREQVLGALQRQVCDAVRSLRAHPEAAFVFLPRGAGYRSYDRALTFSVLDVLEDERTRPTQPPPASVPPPSGLWIRSALEQLHVSEVGFDWLEHVDEAGRTAVGADPDLRLPEHCERGLMGDTTRHVALRSDDGFLVGVRLASNLGHVWGRARGTVLLGAALSALRHTLPVRSEEPVSHEPASVSDELQDEFLRRLLDRCEPLHAVVVMRGRHCVLASKGRLGRRSIVEAARRVSVAWESSWMRGSYAPSVSVLDDCMRIYGSARSQEQPFESVWLVFDRDARPGLGWALLTAATRS